MEGAPTGSARARARAPGALAIVLHTHMPYVESFGTWPFGEEWLWEAACTCYLPLLDLLEQSSAPLTLSLTPVLCDQLAAPGLGERLHRFVQDTRTFTHSEDAHGLRAGGHAELAAELERAFDADYAHSLERFDARGEDLLGAFARHAAWTSCATHAVLPLLATDAGAWLQVRSGIVSHLDRFGEGWRGGFWLPECAHAAHLEPLLASAGARASCVELTGRLGPDAPENLRPLLCDSGLVLFPLDRSLIALVWSDDGYPADGVYRDYHRHTIHHHNPWSNGGGRYDFERAHARARAHAADFVGRVRARLQRDGAALPGGGLAVCALDTELLGHWWYEGLLWLRAVLDECAVQALELVHLDDARERFEPLPVGELKMASERAARGASAAPARSASPSWAASPPSSWGRGHDLRTWSGPSVADLAFATRAAELRTLAAAVAGTAGPAAVRELLALQASDWPFMISRGLAVPYAHERFDGHRDALDRALRQGPGASVGGLRQLAVRADPALLLAS
ncbi:MAG TPA: 1,4-alpha-glucan branching protein domain-containing protein [Solirubrobacteraceae bacterium]|nr:1,4-alpha-glucan branching protein domain-containing protein [Solirubrobacteraceae bacterium]